jgi:hypothetical protein
MYIKKLFLWENSYARSINMPTINTTVAGGPGATVVVTPFYSFLDASANAMLTIIDQANVQMAYDYKYTIELTDASSATILNAFKLSGNGDDLEVNMRANDEEGTQWVDDFKHTVRTVIDNALAEAPLGGANAPAAPVPSASLQTDLYNVIKDQIKSVYGDMIANVLESDWNLRVNVQSVGGANNLHGDFADAGAANHRLLMAQQISNASYQQYWDNSENLVTDALPLTRGDEIVFLFDVRAISQVRAVTLDAGGMAASGTTTGASEVANPDASAETASGSAEARTPGYNTINHVMTQARKVAAFFVQLGSKLGEGAAAGPGEAIPGLNTVEPGSVESRANLHPAANGQTGQVEKAPQGGVDPLANNQ